MLPYALLFLLIVCLICLIICDYCKRYYFRLLFKTSCSILFVLIALSSYCINCKNTIYFILRIAAFIFCLIGDVLLALNKKSDGPKDIFFIYGGISFGIGHIFFSSAFIYLIGLFYSDFLIATIISLLLILFLRFSNKYNFKGMFIMVCTYCILISFMVTKALSFVNVYSIIPKQSLFTITGALLFLISDCVISFIVFGKKKPPKCLTAINLITYYIGQSLLALSLM